MKEFFSLAESTTPFLDHQIKEFAKLRSGNKTFSITYNALIVAPLLRRELLPFVKNGFDIRVSTAWPHFSNKGEEAWLKQKGILFSFDDKQYLGDYGFDILGALSNKPKFKPKFVVDITKNGFEKYKAQKQKYADIPVVSIDNTKMKIIEAFYGTGNSFTRVCHKQRFSLQNKTVVVWGYGRVGKGIVHAVMKSGGNCTIIESNRSRSNLQFAEREGVDSKVFLGLENDSQIRENIKKSDYLVTCTGVKNLISNSLFFNDIINSKMPLMNMGGDDEFGTKFPKSRLLNNGEPANFALEQPTSLEFIDPIMYARNKCVELYENGELVNGLNSFPEYYDNEIVKKFCELWGINEKIINDIWDIDGGYLKSPTVNTKLEY